MLFSSPYSPVVFEYFEKYILTRVYTRSSKDRHAKISQIMKKAYLSPSTVHMLMKT